MKGKLFGQIRTKVLTKGGDLAPTIANIEDNLGFLAQAGHGIRDSRGRYYFLPEDAITRELLEQGTIVFASSTATSSEFSFLGFQGIEPER